MKVSLGQQDSPHLGADAEPAPGSSLAGIARPRAVRGNGCITNQISYPVARGSKQEHDLGNTKKMDYSLSATSPHSMVWLGFFVLPLKYFQPSGSCHTVFARFLQRWGHVSFPPPIPSSPPSYRSWRKCCMRLNNPIPEF